MGLHLAQTPGIPLAAFVIGAGDLITPRVVAVKIRLIVFAGNVTKKTAAFSLPDVAGAGAGQGAAVKTNVLRRPRRLDINHGFRCTTGKGA